MQQPQYQFNGQIVNKSFSHEPYLMPSNQIQVPFRRTAGSFPRSPQVYVHSQMDEYLISQNIYPNHNNIRLNFYPQDYAQNNIMPTQFQQTYRYPNQFISYAHIQPSPDYPQYDSHETSSAGSDFSNAFYELAEDFQRFSANK